MVDPVERLFSCRSTCSARPPRTALPPAQPGLGADAGLDPGGADGGAVHLLRATRTTSSDAAGAGSRPRRRVLTSRTATARATATIGGFSWTTVAEARRPVLRRQGRHRSRRARPTRGRAADPPLRGAAPDADGEPARTPRVFLLDHDLRILIADGEAIRRLDLARRGDVPRPAGRRAVRRGPRRGPRALASTNYRAALQGERRAFEFDSEGLTFAVQAVPVRARGRHGRVRCSSSRATSPSGRAPRSSSRGARASRAPSPSSAASRWRARISTR